MGVGNPGVDNEQQLPANGSGGSGKEIGKKRIRWGKQAVGKVNRVRKTDAEILLQMIHEGINGTLSEKLSGQPITSQAFGKPILIDGSSGLVRRLAGQTQAAGRSQSQPLYTQWWSLLRGALFQRAVQLPVNRYEGGGQLNAHLLYEGRLLPCLGLLPSAKQRR